MKRVFIVGTARSGTTLMHIELCRNAEVFTLPETHLFSRVITLHPALRKLQPYQKDGKDFSRKVFSQLLDKQCGSPVFKSKKAYIQSVLDSLDCTAQNQQKVAWVEKTPLHLRYISELEKSPKAKFYLHVIREPMHNIAALHDVSKRHPESFQQSDLKDAVKRYKLDLATSLKYTQAENHFYVSYEDLVNDPLAKVEAIYKRLELDFSKYDSTREVASAVIESNESWKSKNFKASSFEDKVSSRLSAEEQQYVQNSISEIDLNSKFPFV